jgi:hypothetical protein
MRDESVSVRTIYVPFAHPEIELAVTGGVAV